MNHTKESLGELSFRELQQTAKDEGLHASGTREELIQRILQGTPDSEPSPTDGSGGDESENDSADGNQESSEEEPQRARNDEGQYTADDEGTQPDEAYDPPVSQSLSNRAKRAAGQIVAGYISVESYTEEVEEEVIGALAAGKQPCIVEGTGNARFAVKVFDKPFHADDLTSDVMARQGGVILNVARRLADARLYPSD